MKDDINTNRILGLDMGISSIGWALLEERAKTKEQDDKFKILDCGARIFTKAENPKDGASLALPRRQSRGTRRVLSRKAKRIKAIRGLLRKYNILTKEQIDNVYNSESKNIHINFKKLKSYKDVWELRSDALSRALSKEELARVLIHIAKRRGYKSISSSSEDKDGRKVLGAIKNQKDKLESGDFKTVGQMLLTYPKKRNKKDDYSNCIKREMLESEIDIIFKKQEELDNTFISEPLRVEYKKIAFYQRPLKSMGDMIGKCTFEIGENRAPKGSFSGELFVAISKIINSKLFFHPNTGEVIADKIIKLALKNKKVTFAKIKKELKLSKDYRFSLINQYNQNPEKQKLKISDDFFETDKKILKKLSKNMQNLFDDLKSLNKHEMLKEKLNLDKTRYISYEEIRSLLELPLPKENDSSSGFRFSGLFYDDEYNDNLEKKEKFISFEKYHDLKNAIQNRDVFNTIFENKYVLNEIAVICIEDKDDEKRKKRLYELFNDYLTLDESVKKEAIEDIIPLKFSKTLNLSLKALNKILPFMKKDGQKYNEACKSAGYNHSQSDIRDKKRFLRPLNEDENLQVTSPVVKRAISQLRKVINALIRKYGSFDYINIELGRELKNSKKQKANIKNGQKQYKDEKDNARERWKEQARKNNLAESIGREPTEKELLKFRLYDQQQAKCPYSKKNIQLDRLLQDDSYAEIDHILPYSRTFDNSLNNKVLVLKQENQNKADQTPYEWITSGQNRHFSSFDDFKRYIKALRLKKAKEYKLLKKDLPKKLVNLDEKDSFIARNLIDTQFMSRFAKNFLEKNLHFRDEQKDDKKIRVRSRNGSLTNYLRHVWGIGCKNRDNHLHHVEDAIILALSTNEMLQRVSYVSARKEKFKYGKIQEKAEITKTQNTKRNKPQFESPLNTQDINFKINNILISHMPLRNITGSAHKETYLKTNQIKQEKSKKIYLSKIEEFEKFIKKESFTKEQAESIEKHKENIKNYYDLRMILKIPKEKRFKSIQNPKDFVLLNKNRAFSKKEKFVRADIYRYGDKYYNQALYVHDFAKKSLPLPSKDDFNIKDNSKVQECFLFSIYKGDYLKVEIKETKNSTPVKVEGYLNESRDSSFRIISHNNIGDENFKNTKQYNKKKMYQFSLSKVTDIKKIEISVLGEKLAEIAKQSRRVGSIHQERTAKK